jgi:hypothetical protein
MDLGDLVERYSAMMTGHACTQCGEPFVDGDQVSFGTSNGIGECVGLCCL